jgi:CRISPR-associated protein (TIGR02584 family)
MSAPADHPKRILLAVTGLSPQIVTETLYVLAVARSPAWIPSEIHIITTRKGEENARLSLLSDDPGWFHRFRADYRLPEIAFNQKNIHVMTGPDGKPLDDILTVEDNVAAADFITEQVRALTDDPATSLHVTLAGGRKTMGFYIGYALSLFGRPQDRLSHVLVSPPFESLKEFFYPSPHTKVIHDRDRQPLDAKEARVHLGEIPFVRLRDGLPKRLLEGRAAFSEAVTEAQKSLPPLALALDPNRCTVVAAGKAFELEPLHFAFYWMMADRCRTARGGVHRKDKNLGAILLEYHRRLANGSRVGGRAGNARRKFDMDNFDQTKAKVNRAIRRALGERLAAPYLIVKLDPIAGSRINRFGLLLPSETITIARTSVRAHRDADV